MISFLTCDKARPGKTEVYSPAIASASRAAKGGTPIPMTEPDGGGIFFNAIPFGFVDGTSGYTLQDYLAAATFNLGAAAGSWTCRVVVSIPFSVTTTPPAGAVIGFVGWPFARQGLQPSTIMGTVWPMPRGTPSQLAPPDETPAWADVYQHEPTALCGINFVDKSGSPFVVDPIIPTKPNFIAPPVYVPNGYPSAVGPRFTAIPLPSSITGDYVSQTAGPTSLDIDFGLDQFAIPERAELCFPRLTWDAARMAQIADVIQNIPVRLYWRTAQNTYVTQVGNVTVSTPDIYYVARFQLSRPECKFAGILSSNSCS